MKSFPLLLLLAVPASTLAAAQAPDVNNNKNKKQERIVCKNESQTYSRIGKTRVCRTVAEWGVQSEQAVAELPSNHSYKAQIGNGDVLKGPN